MTQIDIFMACIAVFAAVIICQALAIKSLRQSIERLERNCSDCVSDRLFRLEQSQRRALESQVAAIAQHLKIEIVSKPAVIVVEARK